MLFWAVDNPAPANYLLISGDRDFSNALHQLRMRRYNILLAQPQKASAPLVAAAKSVWLWTSLLAGGPPLTNGSSLTNGESQQVGNNSNLSGSDTLQTPVSSSVQTKQQRDSFSEVNTGNHNHNPMFPNAGKGSDSRRQGKTTRRSSSQPNGPRPLNQSVGLQENHSSINSYRAGSPNVPPNGPAPNFVHGSPGWSNSSNLPGNSQMPYSQPLRPNSYPMQHGYAPNNQYPTNTHSFAPPVVPPRNGAPNNQYPPNTHSFAPSVVPPRTGAPNNQYPQNTHSFAPSIVPPRTGGPNFTPGPVTNVPDIGNLNISGLPKQNSIDNAPHPVRPGKQKNGFKVQKNPPLYRSHSHGPEHSTSSMAAVGSNNPPGNGMWGSSGCPKPSEYVQGLIGVVLLALNTLKNEKIMPTEANITDCIRYGDPKHRNTDVKKALESAIEQQMIVKQNLGALQLYIGKNDKLWKCVNPIGGNPNQHSKETWEEIQKFLTTSSGRLAMMGTQCK